MANNELIGHLTGNPSIKGGTLTRKGEKGDPGRGISSIAEKYAVSTSNTTAPTTWYSNPSDVAMTSTNKYLWNYEIVTYTDNTSEETAKRVIGVYGDKGDKGDTGNTGATGQSAYESAVLGGFSGTQNEFYTSLASIGDINSALDEINGEVV